jgi:hypothetical protein
MKELSIEQMEMVKGGMRKGCAFSLIALGFGAVAVAGVTLSTGGIGFFGAMAVLEVGFSGVVFMESCGPSDF